MLIPFRDNYANRQVLLNVRPEASTVSLDEIEVYSFDGEGRLLTAWLDDQTYVRTLDNRIVKKWRSRGQASTWKSIEKFSYEDGGKFLTAVYEGMRDLGSRLHSGDLCLNEDLGNPERALEVSRKCLGRITAWNGERLDADRRRFLSVYSPVGILPPDQYLAVVLQATVGCHWNRCSFCDFYRETPFHIRSESEFRQHIQNVKDFMGESMGLRRSVFLGDANALVTPQARLLGFFDVINQEFEFHEKPTKSRDKAGKSVEGIYSFLDVFTGERKSQADYEALRSRNLRRVYVGVETGCDELLRFLNKPASAVQAMEVISTIKGANLNVGVIVLVGIGGNLYSTVHVEQTVDLLNRLSLGKGDLLYFSPLWESPATEYGEQAARIGTRPLTESELRKQLASIREGLRFSGNDRPKIAMYDIREFVY